MKYILALCRQDLRTHKQAFSLLAILFGFFLLRFPSLFEPYWYGDEGIYQVVGMAMREGRLLYQGVWDNKPPLLYLLYALVNGDLFFIKLLSLLAGLAAVVAFFFVAKKLFRGESTVYLTTILFVILFGTPLLEGNIANAENFMLLPIFGAALLVLQTKPKQLFLAGILCSVAFLMKVVAIFDLAAFSFFLLFLVMLEKKKNVIDGLQEVLHGWIMLAAGFMAPIVLTCLFFIAKGAWKEFLGATLGQNITYISYSNTLFGTQGFLIIKLILLGLFILLLFTYRKLFTKTQIFIMFWLVFSLFNAFFAQRPYTHYLLVLLPSICLLIGEIWQTKQFRFIGFLILIFILSLIPKNFWIYGKTLTYYQNFINFVGGEERVEQYQAFFDQSTPGYYEAAGFINTHTKGNSGVFVWTNAAQVYALARKLPPGRLTASYHITFYPEAEQETIKAIAAKKPTYIILLMPITGHETLLKNYTLRFILSKGAIIYERSS